MKNKYVSPLTDAQRKQLREIMENDSSARARKRAHGILLSESGYTIEEIADLYFVKRDTVSVWIDAWEQRGLEGLYDHPRSGRPTALNALEQERAIELLKQFPRRIKLVIQTLREEFGKPVSTSTLKRLARALKGRWKRVRRSLRSKRDQQQFDAAKAELEQLRRRQQRGEIGLFYFDESGFTLEPPIPYAWQFPDEQIEIPSSKSRRLNVLGFLSPDNTFHSFVFECSVNSEVVIACFDYLSEQITQETWVVLDNAPTHTSDAFEECLQRWKAKGLFIQRIPAYSPELNLIEILWHMIKYFWLPFSAYASFETLVEAVEDILRHIGTRFRIHFKEVAVQGLTS
jgi:transposase